MTLRQDLADLLTHPNVLAFLRVIRGGESSQSDEAYRMMVGGKLVDDLSAHPNVVVRVPGLPPSTAAGAYQFLGRTWLECRDALELPDFSPDSQDLACLYLIRRRGALPAVLRGDLEEAIEKCNREWASLPGSPYGQPTRTLAQCRAVWNEYGGGAQPPDAGEAPEPPLPAAEAGVPPREAGAVPDEPTPQERTTMLPALPLISALLPTLVDAIPKLAGIFRPGSPVAERNVKAATTVFEIAKQALGAANEQEVAQRVQADPAAAATVAKAVESRWFEIAEAGGGGIAAARAADATAMARGGLDFLHSPSFWVAVLLLPLVYLVVLSLIGMIGTATWSDDVRAGLAGSLISAVIGGLVGYYYGQTTSRNRAGP